MSKLHLIFFFETQEVGNHTSIISFTVPYFLAINKYEESHIYIHI